MSQRKEGKRPSWERSWRKGRKKSEAEDLDHPLGKEVVEPRQILL